MGFFLRSIVVAWFAIVFSRLPWLIRLVGPVFVRWLALGLPGGPNGLLTVRGRRSGLSRRIPVAVMPLGDSWFVQSPYGSVQWVQNLRMTPRARLQVGRRVMDVEAAELTPEAAATLFRRQLEPYPRSQLLLAILGNRFRPPAPNLDYFRLRMDSRPDEYLDDARKHPTFELREVDRQS